MRNYIYKVIIATIAAIVVFEFTIGKQVDEFNNLTQRFISKEGRKEMVISLKNEMRKAIKKENYLSKEERILINQFISKIKKELNSVENN